MKVLALILCALVVAAATSTAGAQDKFPTKPITMIIGFAPGGLADVPLRYLSQFVSKKLGQPVIVVNKEGSGGAIALSAIKRAEPDGYTIGHFATGGVMVPHLAKVDYDPVNDFSPIIQHIDSPAGICVLADSTFKTLNEMIAHSKANPGKVSYAFAGIGTPQHVAMIQLEEVAKPGWVGVPYGGGAPVLSALLGGHVTFIAQTAEWAPHVKAGKMRLLALLTADRLEGFDAPTLKDLGYDIAAPSIIAVAGPKGIPQERVRILHDALHEGMQTPGFVEIAKKFNVTAKYRNPQDLQKYIEFVYTTSGKVLEKVPKQK